MLGTALALLALVASACVGSYSRAVEETRAGLVGLSARDLRRCLGAPTEFDTVGEVEQQTYRFELERDDAFSSHGWDGPVVVGRGTSGSGGFETHRDRLDQSYCQLDFELRGGVVTAVRSDGRDARGMNASGACLLEARRCIPSDEDEPPE